MQFDKKLYFDVGLLSNNNWIKATTEDGQPNGLMYLVQNLSNLEPNHLLVHLFLMGILLLYISTNLTTFNNDVTATNCDLRVDGDVDFNDCDLTVQGDIIMDGASTDEFRLKGGLFDKGEYFLGGMMSYANAQLTSANGISQIEASRNSSSPNSEKDGVAIRKGLGGHIVNFVKEDNRGIMGKIIAIGANDVRYDTFSDRRLKTNTVDMRSMIDKIMELKPRESNWKADNQHDYGSVAQEIHKVFPHIYERRRFLLLWRRYGKYEYGRTN